MTQLDGTLKIGVQSVVKKSLNLWIIVCCRHLFTMVDLVLFQKHEMKVYPKLNSLNKIISLFSEEKL